MQLARQSATVPGIPEECGNQDLVLRYALPVLPAAGSPRVAPSQKGGAAWRADGALAKSVGKGGPLSDEGIEDRRRGMGISEGPDGIIPLLVGADPEDVGLFGHALGRNGLPVPWQESLQVG